MGPVIFQATETLKAILFFKFFITLAEMTFPQQAFLPLLLLLLMKFTDKHLNGREKGSLFLSTGLRGVGLLCGILL